ncbi:hypothetical protein K488DRAFT_83653 [Vararia minispora EC-137]|uniref:Uncharacterized protein n=1 Tax=Vararia minispora EC-137 TaxID=1314806 RepID=A0ACB8QSK2_9AGAM|nr:hypothetical protein K488DRAFT_83653 [Vararia minispora EC-137]
MLANSVNVLVLATIAANVAPAALAVPLRTAKRDSGFVSASSAAIAPPLIRVGLEERSETTIVGGTAPGVGASLVSETFGSNRRSVGDVYVDPDTGVIYADMPDSQNASKRSIKAIGTAIAGGLASGAAGSIISNLLNNRNAGDVFMDETGTIYVDMPDTQDPSKRSIKAIGTAIAGGLASGAAGSLISNLLNNREVQEERSIKAIGTAIAGGLASGAAGSVISHFLNNRDVGDMYLDTGSGVVYMDMGNGTSPSKRSVKAIGTAIAGGLAAGAAGSVISNLLNNRAAGDMYVDTDTGVIYADMPDAQDPSKRSVKAIGTAIAGGLASGAAGSLISNLLNNREVHEERSIKAIGTAIAGGLASGAAGSVISHFLNNRDVGDMYVDPNTGVVYVDMPDTQDPSKRSIKAIGTAIAGGLASGAAGSFVSNLLNNREVQEERSIKAIGTAIAGGLASGAAGSAISHFLNNRDVGNMFLDTDSGVVYMDVGEGTSPSKRSVKAIGTAIVGGLASGAAGSVISNLLNNREVADALAARSIDELD